MHAREGYSSHFVTLSVCLSVCHFSILEKEPFSGLKLTPVHSRTRFKSFKCSTLLIIEAIMEKKPSGTSAVNAVFTRAPPSH